MFHISTFQNLETVASSIHTINIMRWYFIKWRFQPEIIKNKLQSYP